MRSRSSVLTTLALCTLALACVSTAGGPRRERPRVIPRAGGESEVIFPNGCAVDFDSRGRQVGSSARCRSAQLREARAIIERRGDVAGGPLSRDWPGAPQLFEARDGSLEVRFPDGCEVYYDARGRRVEQRVGCRTGQLQRADDAVAEYRPRYLPPSEREAEPDDGPRVVPRRFGAVEIRFANGCVVEYDAQDRETRRLPACRDAQVRRSLRALIEHRRERAAARGRLEGGGPDGPGPRIVERRGGEVQVIFQNECAVYYSADGRELRRLPFCRAEQVRLAERALQDYLRTRPPAPGRVDRGRRSEPQQRPGPEQGRPPAERDEREQPQAPGALRIIRGVSGNSQVVFGNGCTVEYDASGARSESSPECRRGQLRRADRAARAQQR